MELLKVIALLMPVLRYVVAPNPTVEGLAAISLVQVVLKTEEVFEPIKSPTREKPFFTCSRKEPKQLQQKTDDTAAYIVEKAIPSSSFAIVKQIDDTRGCWIVVKDLEIKMAALNSGQNGYKVHCIESINGIQYMLTSASKTVYTMEGLTIMENVYFYEFGPNENSIPACIANKGAFIVIDENLKKRAFIALSDDSFLGGYRESSSNYGGDTQRNLEINNRGKTIILQGPYLGFGFTPEGEAN